MENSSERTNGQMISKGGRSSHGQSSVSSLLLLLDGWLVSPMKGKKKTSEFRVSSRYPSSFILHPPPTHRTYSSSSTYEEPTWEPITYCTLYVLPPICTYCSCSVSHTVQYSSRYLWPPVLLKYVRNIYVLSTVDYVRLSSFKTITYIVSVKDTLFHDEIYVNTTVLNNRPQRVLTKEETFKTEWHPKKKAPPRRSLL